MPQTTHASTEVTLETGDLLRILHGVKVATKAPDALALSLEEHLQEIGNPDAKESPLDHGSYEGWRPWKYPLAFDFWRESLANLPSKEHSATRHLANVVLAVTFLREKVRRGQSMSAEDLDNIWALLQSSIIEGYDTELKFNVARSAQGFFAIPLCSLIQQGKIEELWRVHVWLPDGERGLPDIAIHAHQPFAQSWVLAGSGTDHTFHVEATNDASLATHALYEPRYNTTDSQSSKQYQTHQLSSTITNTGKLMKVSPARITTHGRNDSYEIPDGVYHKSAVPGDRFHATLFVFDASRGFQPNVGVLGPPNGQDSTQLRDSAGITADVLVHVVDASRRREQTHNENSDGDEHSTVLAYVDFFRGLRLKQQGRLEAATLHLSPCNRLSPAHAFAREPSCQHRRYISKLAEAGGNFDLVDEAGYTALDYALYNEDSETIDLIVAALRYELDEGKIHRRLYEANVRKGYREVFEQCLRPILRTGHKDTLGHLRRTYATILEESKEKAQLFDNLKFVWYSDFCTSGRLPRFSDGNVKTFLSEDSDTHPHHIVYIAYRWITKDPVTGKTANDDKEHTQYHRMLSALHDYLLLHYDIDQGKLGIWLDSSCIFRGNPLPGIAALPINLAQCNTLITIEDEQFWERAWCSVEALIIQILRRRYQIHQWFRYTAIKQASLDTDWILSEATLDIDIDMSTKSMTWEEDRDKITFLERQASLL